MAEPKPFVYHETPSVAIPFPNADEYNQKVKEWCIAKGITVAAAAPSTPTASPQGTFTMDADGTPDNVTDNVLDDSMD